MSDQGKLTIGARIGQDIIAAMRAKSEHSLTTLRMVKSALRNKEIDKREPLTDAEETQILTTLIKQRRESVDSFTKGGRPELAEKEKLEIDMIERYLPQAATDEEIRHVIVGALHTMAANNNGIKPGPRDLGVAMRVVQTRIQTDGLRADGKTVSELLRAELAK